MTLTYDLTADDLLHSTLAQLRFLRRWAIGFAIFLAATWLLDLIFIAVVGFRDNKAEDLALQIAITTGGCTAMILLMRFLVLPWQFRKRVREHPFLFSGIAMTADDQGIAFRNTKTSSQWQWSELLGFRETGHVILICRSKSFCHAVPKRVLSGAEGDAIRSLISAKLTRLP